jgi:hypothetical protein
MLEEDAFPNVYRTADQAAARAQARLYRLTAALLVFALVASVFGSVSLKSDHIDWAAVGSLLALVASITVSEILRRGNPNRRWYGLRALAESVKSLTWLYSVGGGDFGRATLNDAQANREIGERLRALLSEYYDILQESDQEITTAKMAELRGSSLAKRRETYRRERLEDQLAWYRRRAGEHSRQRDFWVWAAIGLQLVAFAVAALRLVELIDINLVGIATTAATGAVAWQRGHDHAGVAEAYARTAQELKSVSESIDDATSELEWADFVASAESAMSREHTSWWARRRHFRPS